MPDWFRRFGDIPGVTYAPSEQIDRHSLAGCDDVPEEHEVFPRDRESTTLWWPASGGSRGGSASPVHRRAFSAFRDSRDVPVAAILQNAYEGLELPGEPSDYHFLIQRTAGELWGLCHKKPELLVEVERLCWLDIGLIQACPAAAGDLLDGQARSYSIAGFWLLIRFYEERDDLADALKVAEIAAAYGQGEFTANGISHECEPRWPRHPEFNPSGAKRADWLLEDSTYVECAGMLDRKDYAEKIALKQQLAKAVGIPLIVVGPTDMHRLAEIFAGQCHPV